MSFAADATPRLRAKAQLRFDRRDRRWLLLYPERGLVLSDVAAAVLGRCNGAHSVREIVDQLAAEPGAPARVRVEAVVTTLLHSLGERGLLDP